MRVRARWRDSRMLGGCDDDPFRPSSAAWRIRTGDGERMGCQQVAAAARGHRPSLPTASARSTVDLRAVGASASRTSRCSPTASSSATSRPLACYGAPLPLELRRASSTCPSSTPASRLDAGECAAIASPASTSTVLRGLPIASAADVWCQLSPLVGREDLVAVGDYLVTGPRSGRGRAPALETVESLAAAAARHARKRGAAGTAWALPRIRIGVDSRPETLLRLLLVRARLPEPEIGAEVPSCHGGLVLHPDLAYSRWRVAFDYEGDDHRVRRDVWLRDIERRELMEDAGWRVVRVTAADLFTHPDAFVERVRRIIASAEAQRCRMALVAVSTNPHRSAAVRGARSGRGARRRAP